MSEPISVVVVVHDYAMVRAGLGAAIDAEPGITVVGTASSLVQTLELLTMRSPDVVVISSRVDEFGARTVAWLAEQHLPTAVLLLSGAGHAAMAEHAARAGCSGFVGIEQDVDDLVDAVRAVAAGRAVFPASAVHRALTSGDRADGQLTGRELDVLRLLQSELSGPEIADRLVVALSTVRTHTKGIYGKLGVSNRRAAVRRAAELGLL